MTGLGRNEQFVPIGRERRFHDLPEGSFGRTVGRTVVISQVEMRDTLVERIVKFPFAVRKSIHIAEVVPQAQRDFR